MNQKHLKCLQNFGTGYTLLVGCCDEGIHLIYYLSDITFPRNMAIENSQYIVNDR